MVRSQHVLPRETGLVTSKSFIHSHRRTDSLTFLEQSTAPSLITHVHVSLRECARKSSTSQVVKGSRDVTARGNAFQQSVAAKSMDYSVI